jgi:site-specific recombinase XerC
MHYVVDRAVPLPIVQKQVGHRNLKTTSVYLAPSSERVAEAYNVAYGKDKENMPTGYGR